MTHNHAKKEQLSLGQALKESGHEAEFIRLGKLGTSNADLLAFARRALADWNVYYPMPQSLKHLRITLGILQTHGGARENRGQTTYRVQRRGVRDIVSA